jgi:hypothetical protein
VKLIFLTVCLALAASCSAQVASEVLAHVTVLALPEARAQALDRDRVASQLSQITSYLRLPAEQLPNIVVVYANPQAARVARLPEHSKITLARITIQDAVLYQVWITGRASDADTIHGLVHALNSHYGLNLGEARIAEVGDRIVRQMSAVVSAGELARKHH